MVQIRGNLCKQCISEIRIPHEPFDGFCECGNNLDREKLEKELCTQCISNLDPDPKYRLRGFCTCKKSVIRQIGEAWSDEFLKLGQIWRRKGTFVKDDYNILKIVSLNKRHDSKTNGKFNSTWNEVIVMDMETNETIEYTDGDFEAILMEDFESEEPEIQKNRLENVLE